MKETHCAYCGKFTKCDREHVFPKCLYPPSNKSKIQLLTVPACNDCNNSWSNDEAHFRNMLVLAGEYPNAPRQELWETKIQRSFDERDGLKRRNDLIAKMKPTKVNNNNERYMIFPGDDERVMRVVKKIIRGLCHYHEIMSPVSDQHVWASVMEFMVPQDLLEQTSYHHREIGIVEYRYELSKEKGTNSNWLITFFQQVTFIGIVFTEKVVFDKAIGGFRKL
jgi:hypothetical protein